ncbi:MAG: ACT domain-containing protein [Candidatus Latescibacteria bacterium]|nr:ACT domain-containing protein [Candidatus Latescibacterota bacterium]
MFTIKVLPTPLAVCRLAPDTPLQGLPLGDGFWSVTRTADELSVVLAGDGVPPHWRAERGWRGLQVQGPLDFSMIGVLAELSGVLAAAQISLFALSTYDTDYLLVQQGDLGRAVEVLAGRGHRIEIEEAS